MHAFRDSSNAPSPFLSLGSDKTMPWFNHATGFFNTTFFAFFEFISEKGHPSPCFSSQVGSYFLLAIEASTTFLREVTPNEVQQKTFN